MPPSDSAADRVRIALDGAFDDPQPEDRAGVEDPVAGTVLLLRDDAAGPRVLMIERPDRGSFAGAWVFPGGKREPGDEGETEEDAARAAGARETWEETGLVVATDALLTLSCWQPPLGARPRIRTWFFVAEAPVGELALAADEAVSAAWVRPADMLGRHARGQLTLYPPTWVTLHGLTAQPDAAAVLAATRLGGVERFESIARRTPAGTVMLWRGDAEYDPEGEPGASTARHRLQIGDLPWIYTRTEA